LSKVTSYGQQDVEFAFIVACFGSFQASLVVEFLYRPLVPILYFALALFFWFLKKCQNDDHLRFGEAFYLFVHPSF